MQIQAQLPVMVANQGNFLESNTADALWEELCDNFLPEYPFTLSEAIDASALLQHYGPSAQRNYMRLIIRAVMADFEHRPDDYANIPPIRELPQRRGREKLYVL